MGIHISIQMSIPGRRKKKATSMLIHMSMNTSTGISTNMRTKAHPVCTNMRRANTAYMSICMPAMKKKSMNTTTINEFVLLWNFLTLLRTGCGQPNPQPNFSLIA
jgi:hypothetical protein